MLSTEFTIPLGKHFLPSKELTQKEKTFLLMGSSVHERKELTRFFLVDYIERTHIECRKDERWIKFLSVLSKIIKVITTIFIAFMGIAIYYLPAWIPWGIVLPSVILLSIVDTKLRQHVETYRHKLTFLPFVQEFFNHQSLKSLHPIGEWDLPEQDKRLRSDESEFHKKHPDSWKSIHPIGKWDLAESGKQSRSEHQKLQSKQKADVETLIKNHDLEITPLVQSQIAGRFAGMNDLETRWSVVKKSMHKARVDFRRGSLEKYKRMHRRAFNTTYADFLPVVWQEQKKWVRDVIEGRVALPPEVAKRRVEAATLLYHSFSQLFPKVEKLLEEGKLLYAPFAFLSKSTCLDAGWKNYLEYAKSVKEKMVSLAELIEKEEWLLALQYIKELKLKQTLFDLFDQTRQMESMISAWIKSHPSKRLANLEEDYERLKTSLLSDSKMKVFYDWITSHPKSKEKKTIDLVKNSSFPKEVRLWLDDHPLMGLKTASDLFNRFLKIRQKMKNTGHKLIKLRLGQQTILDSESYAKYSQALGNFDRKILSPLTAYINNTNRSSICKAAFRGLFYRLPLQPFNKEKLPRHPALRQRKIEEILLDKMLKQIDAKMNQTHYIRVGLLRVPLILLAAIDGIILLYFPTPWFFWGSSFLAAISSGISYYIDHRLIQVDKKKQGIKLQHLLINYPDIGAVPRNRAPLIDLKKMQAKYGLEGVRPTWARVLTEGNHILEQPNNLGSAKKVIKKLCKQGSEKATKYLESYLVCLYSHCRKEGAHPVKGKMLKKRINEIEKTLQPTVKQNKNKYIKRELNTYEKLIRARNLVDTSLDVVIEKMMALQKKQADYERQSQKFDWMMEQIELLRKKQTTLTVQFSMIKRAMSEDQGRDESTEQIETILEDIEEIAEILGEDQETCIEKLVEPFNRLKALPKEKLFIYREGIKHAMKQLPQLQYVLKEDKDYKDFGSKEAVDGKINKIKKQLPQLEQQHKQLKEKYNTLSLEISALRPEF